MKTNTVEKMDYTQEKIYQEAMQRIDDLVEEVVNICDEVAEKNNYEKEWVFHRFQEKFSKRKRNL